MIDVNYSCRQKQLSLLRLAIKRRFNGAAACKPRKPETGDTLEGRRHPKIGAATEALAADVRAECRRLGLPEARVESSNVRGAPGIGLTGNVALLFERRVEGPLLLGRARHLGGGLFRPVEEIDQP